MSTCLAVISTLRWLSPSSWRCSTCGPQRGGSPFTFISRTSATRVRCSTSWLGSSPHAFRSLTALQRRRMLSLILSQSLSEGLFPPINLGLAALLSLDERVRPFPELRILFLHFVKRRVRAQHYIA